MGQTEGLGAQNGLPTGSVGAPPRIVLTTIVLFIGFFANNTSVIKIGGIVGVVTAVVAWYTSAAIVVNTMRGGAPTLPVGKPFWAPRPSV